MKHDSILSHGAHFKVKQMEGEALHHLTKKGVKLMIWAVRLAKLPVTTAGRVTERHGALCCSGIFYREVDNVRADVGATWQEPFIRTAFHIHLSGTSNKKYLVSLAFSRTVCWDFLSKKPHYQSQGTVAAISFYACFIYFCNSPATASAQSDLGIILCPFVGVAVAVY